jgi:hypothetical protein
VVALVVLTVDHDGREVVLITGTWLRPNDFNDSVGRNEFFRNWLAGAQSRSAVAIVQSYGRDFNASTTAHVIGALIHYIVGVVAAKELRM